MQEQSPIKNTPIVKRAKRVKTLHVIRKHVSLIETHWKINRRTLADGALHCTRKTPGDCVYVRCDANGYVNWPHTLIYTLEELIELNNVKVIPYKSVFDE